MQFPILPPSRVAKPRLWQRMFNLNDPRWGRGDDSTPPQNDSHQPPQAPNERPQQPQNQAGDHNGKRPDGPPDLDELWQDLNRKLGGLLGGKGNGGNSNPPPQFGGGNNQPPRFQLPKGMRPDGKGTRVGVGMILGALGAIWVLSGFFIVQEGQQSVITQFGKYDRTVGAGINWHFPYPIERNETVNVTQIRSVDIGTDKIIQSTGLRDSAMLTADENIVEIKFAVQYRLNNARDYLFASRNPDQAVVQAAETAVREVIGNMRMDAALAEERDQIAPRVRNLMQEILDRYKLGVEVVGVNLQQGGVRPPEQVQAAFDDVLKAGQERERAKNDAQAYANRVVPLATGTASRLLEEAAGYKQRVISQAAGDADRFNAILPEYQKAPKATRDRMYNDTMQQVYSSVTKIVVDTKQGSMLYLPLDKILQMNQEKAQQSTAPAAAAAAAASASAASAPAPAASAAAPAATDNSRSRESSVARSRNQ